MALKEEKADKNKKILKFEYEILKDLQGKWISFKITFTTLLKKKIK